MLVRMPTAQPDRALWTVRTAARLLRLVYRPRIEGAAAIPTTGAAVVAGNHFHAFDPLLVTASTPRRMYTLAKLDLFDGPFGWLFRAIGAIPVDQRAAHNHSALDAAIARLREGVLINVSPEGSRNRTTALLLPFKAGAVAMARAVGCPVIPYAIAGTYRPGGKVRIRYGAPLDVTTMPFDDAMTLLRDTIAGLLTALRGEPLPTRVRPRPAGGPVPGARVPEAEKRPSSSEEAGPCRVSGHPA